MYGCELYHCGVGTLRNAAQDQGRQRSKSDNENVPDAQESTTTYVIVDNDFSRLNSGLLCSL